jgi:3-deoxy-D-manno-octulosonic-acid transferase
VYALYNLLLALAGIAVIPMLALPRYRGHRERLGRYPQELGRRLAGRRVLWLHSASVGELLASRPLVRRFREELPSWAIVLSTTSFAGRDLARNLADAEGAVLLPFDLPICVEHAVDTLRPSLFVFTETEIWPNLLRALGRRGVPALLLSGRISPRSFRRYRWVRPFLRRVLADVSLFGMQSEAEAERIRELGAPAERVRVTGNLKLDAQGSEAALAIEVDGPLWIAASTHEGEETACLRVFRRLQLRFAGLRLLLAPRHLDRLGDVERALRREGVGFVRRSALADGRWTGQPEVLLLDTLGELAGLYEGAAVAFVGGTLARVGGHNLLEPARAAVPVLYGPHVDNVVAIAEALEAAGGGCRVRDESELESRLASLLADPDASRRIGDAARASVRSEAGGAASADGRAVEASFRAAAEFLRV